MPYCRKAAGNAGESRILLIVGSPMKCVFKKDMNYERYC